VPRVYPGGRFSAGLATVEALLSFAHNLKRHRIVGGPDWVREHWFEINAKARNEVSIGEIRLMVRSLLEDRFKLVTHTEERTMRVLALVRAHPNEPLGPQLVAIDECSPRAVNELRRKFPEKYPTAVTSGLTSACSSMGLGVLADFLALVENAPVIDLTGLSGDFYFTLRSNVSLATAAVGGNADPSLPSLPAALDEQLGLKLESRRVALDVLVIDSVQEPTDN
jgi:uncharacterized protein (TIGR03435 family)